ncbi:MAG: hypothetical protein AAFX05_07810 [Planctomycetota bacterium]
MNDRITRISLFASIGFLSLVLGGCAGGSAKARVHSSPDNLTAYAIPANIWRARGSAVVLENLEEFGDLEFRFSNPTETEQKTLDAKRYVFVVTDGTSHGYLEKNLTESTRVHEIHIELTR